MSGNTKGFSMLETEFLDFVVEKFPVFGKKIGRGVMDLFFAALCDCAARWVMETGKPVPLGFCRIYALPQRVDFWSRPYTFRDPGNAALLNNVLLWSVHAVPDDRWLQSTWDYENEGVRRHGPCFQRQRWEELCRYFEEPIQVVGHAHRTQAMVPAARVVDDPAVGGEVLAPA